jgi:hypothetical protein
LAEPVIAYAVGWDANDRLARDPGEPITSAGVSDIYRLRVHRPDAYSRIHVIPSYFDQPARYDLAQADVLLNLITDPDQNPRVLAVLAQMLEEFRGRVINRPENVLETGRDRVARRLAGLDGLNVPKVLRLDGDDIAGAAAAIEDEAPSFPMILRKTGTHTGRIFGLMDIDGALLAEMAQGKS